jgi:hypothetical protein
VLAVAARTPPSVAAPKPAAPASFANVLLLIPVPVMTRDLAKPAPAYTRWGTERDRMFTERLSDLTRRLGVPVIEVDTTMTEDDLLDQVTDLFGL